MGKRGPCCHCGITSTPLWRNGPPGKPVLCNACGSRWRTKGTLANYTPLHARAPTPFDSEDSQNSQEDKLTHLTEPKSWCIKVHNESKMEDGQSLAAYHPYSTGFEDDTSNRSSSGSAISFSESCVQFGNTDGNEISGPFQSSFCDLHIPSRKRTRIRRHSPSPVEKLRRDLVDILHQQESSYLSEFSDEVLIFEREDLTFSSEIGHGSILLKPPVSSKEEESEASSHIIENKVSCLNEIHLGSSCWSVQSQNNGISSSQLRKERLIQDTGGTNELTENPVKKRVLVNKFLENRPFSDPDNLGCKYPSRIHVNEKPSTNESFSSAKEVSSPKSHGFGSGISIPAKRTWSSPDFNTYEGTSSGTMSTFKRPKERRFIQMLTSDDESLDIQPASSVTGALSALSQKSLNSDVVNSISTVEVELP